MGLKVGLQLLQQAGKVATNYADDAVGIFCRKAKPIKSAKLEGLRFTPDAVGDTMQVAVKPRVWQNLTRSEISFTELSNLGVNCPTGTTKITKILGKKADGSITEIYTFKNRSGENLGSITNFPGGRKLEINIARNRNVCSASSTEKALKIQQQFTDNSRKLVTRREYRGEELLREDKTFSEIFKVDPDMKEAPASLWRQAFQVDKPSDVDKLYMSVIRTGKKPLMNGETRFSQSVMQLETGHNPSKISFSARSRMATDGEVTLESIAQNGVNMDTSNPYFQTILMDSRDMARATYADIVKRRGLKGIEPPLLFDDTSNVFTGKYTNCAGGCSHSNDFIAINLRRNTKASIADTLGHECEHGFTQHADIHLAGIADLRSKNPYSRRFFDGIVNRFNRVKKGSAEYERAKVYAQEANKYDDIAFSGGEDNMRAYLSLNAEKDAFRAGELEVQVFEKCFDDFVNNFNLFNRSYMLRY